MLLPQPDEHIIHVHSLIYRCTSDRAHGSWCSSGLWRQCRKVKIEILYIHKARTLARCSGGWESCTFHQRGAAAAGNKRKTLRERPTTTAPTESRCPASTWSILVGSRVSACTFCDRKNVRRRESLCASVAARPCIPLVCTLAHASSIMKNT